MFSVYHFIWLVISIVVIVVTLKELLKRKTPLRKLLVFAFYVGILVELIKIFSLVRMIPSGDGLTMYPYIETQHVPINLCSLQKFFIIYVLITKNKEGRNNMLTFMYPSGLIGALIALFVPAGASIEWSFKGILLNPQAYQFFLYHALLVIIGAYIPLSKEVHIMKKHIVTSASILGVLGLISMYLNSAFANVDYVKGVVDRVQYTPNYLFTYKPPINIRFTQLWHWYLYLFIIAFIAILIISLLYLPFIKNQKNKGIVSNL